MKKETSLECVTISTPLTKAANVSLAPDFKIQVNECITKLKILAKQEPLLNSILINISNIQN